LRDEDKVCIRAESDSRLIVFAEEGFWRLLRLCPAISSEIFRAMAARLRNLEGSRQQREKLAALGTMSAGLAFSVPSSRHDKYAIPR
ncbi:MAG: hypothetical protein WBL39_05765, partial [Terrimicrobiaceae bacterium]